MTAEQLRKVSGGVVGHFTPKEIAIDAAKLAVSANNIGLKVPANKFVYGAYIKNEADDLASGGAATVKVTGPVVFTSINPEIHISGCHLLPES